MAALGSYLRELRERRGLSLEEMARATRVATRYLEALEADDFRSLPAPPFTRGFIRAWCQTVGADPAEALDLYQRVGGDDARLPAPPIVEAERAVPAHARPRSQGPVLVSFVLLVVLGVALFAVTLALQSNRDRTVHRAQVEPPRPAPVTPSASPGDPVTRTEPASPEPSRVPPATAGASVVPAAPAASSAGTVPAESPGVPYRLVARVSEPTWIRVRTAEGQTTEETIPAGEVREWVSSEPFVLTVGNAGGVSLELNGRALPPLGARGAVIQRMVVPPPVQ